MVTFSKIFWKLLPIFLEKYYIIYFYGDNPDIVSYTGKFLHKEEFKRLKYDLQPNFLQKIGW